MPSSTYSDCWRLVRLYCPAAPTFLAREWINVAYKQLTASRAWAFLRKDGVLQIAASRSLTSVGVTLGSPTVTSAALFLAADAGRQFRLSGGPIYTVQTFTDASTLQLDRVYGEPTNAAVLTATILDAYATMPADFGSFRLIADPYTQRRLAFWIHEDQLNLYDPMLQFSDSGPRALVARAPSTYTPTLGRLQFQLWPTPTAARSYPYLYNVQADNLNDTDTLTGVLADGSQVLVAGALAAAARWPGTADLKNPYFNRDLAQLHQAEFLTGIQKLSLRDDEQYPDDLQRVDWSRWPLADLAYNDLALRASDATVGDYY